MRSLSLHFTHILGRTEPRSADFQSAVSRISNPQALRNSNTCRLAAVAPKRRYGAPRRRKVGDTAGWKPALLTPCEMRVRRNVLCRFSETSARTQRIAFSVRQLLLALLFLF